MNLAECLCIWMLYIHMYTRVWMQVHMLYHTIIIVWYVYIHIQIWPPHFALKKKSSPTKNSPKPTGDCQKLVLLTGKSTLGAGLIPSYSRTKNPNYMKGGFTNQSIHFSICVLKRVSLQLLFFQNTKKAQLCNSLINLINSTGAKLNFKKKTWTTPWNAPMASYRAVDPHGTDGRSDARRESSGSSLAVMKKRWVNTGKVWFFNTYIYIYIYSPSIFL